MVGPFFLVERTITGDIYLNLSDVCFSQADDTKKYNAACVVFQQDGNLHRFSLQVCTALNASLQISGLEAVN
jgi:hypothetical protein